MLDLGTHMSTDNMCLGCTQEAIKLYAEFDTAVDSLVAETEGHHEFMERKHLQ